MCRGSMGSGCSTGSYEASQILLAKMTPVCSVILRPRSRRRAHLFSGVMKNCPRLVGTHQAACVKRLRWDSAVNTTRQRGRCAPIGDRPAAKAERTLQQRFASRAGPAFLNQTEQPVRRLAGYAMKCSHSCARRPVRRCAAQGVFDLPELIERR